MVVKTWLPLLQKKKKTWLPSAALAEMLAVATLHFRKASLAPRATLHHQGNIFLLLKSLDNLAATQGCVLSEDTICQIREAKVHCQYASVLLSRAVKPVQVAIARAETAKTAAAASKVAAVVALEASRCQQHSQCIALPFGVAIITKQQ